MNHPRRPSPSLAELDLIGRARLHAERLSESLSPAKTIYVQREAMSAMFCFPDDASLAGFERTHDGFAFRGHPIKGAP